MSRFKSYIDPTLINGSKHEPTSLSSQSTQLPLPRHVTQITVGTALDDKPPIPPTRFPMVNRLTSNIDESLVNLNSSSQKAQLDQEQAMNELDQVFMQLRAHLEQRYRQFEYKIKSSFTQYDQYLYELKSRLKQVRDELILNFTCRETTDDDHEHYTFDSEKYRHLEMLTSRTINQTIDEQTVKPRFHIELKSLEQLDDCFTIRCDEQPPSEVAESTQYNSSRDVTPIQRRMSVETSTSTYATDEYDNVPNDDYGHYHVSYHHALKTPMKILERWSYALQSGNYFIPLLTPYRQSSILLYCLDRESFVCYNSQSSASSSTVIKWRGTRPSAVYWFDEMNMLFVACATHVYGCYVDEDIAEYQRIQIRIPVEQTSTWSDTQGQLCWPKFLTCGGGIDRLLYAYWTDPENKISSTGVATAFIYYQIERNNYLIKSRFSIDGRLRAMHSTLSTYRLGLLIEQLSNQGCHLEVRTLRDFALLSKFELRTTFEQFHYGCSLTNILFNSNSYLLCDHKQKQLWHVNGDTGDMKVKHMKEPIYSVACLLDGTFTSLIGVPMRFDFVYDPNDAGIILTDLFTQEESFEV